MHEHGLFVANVFAHLVALMSGIASFAFAVYETAKNKPIKGRMFWAIGALCLLIAFDQAWRDEHHNAEQAMAARQRDTSDLSSCTADLRAAVARASVFERLSGSEQSNLNGALTAFNSQQTAMNNCVVALGKSNTPEPLRVTSFFYELPKFAASTPSGPVKIAIIVAETNKVVNPVRASLDCASHVELLDYTLMFRAEEGVSEFRIPATQTSDRSYAFGIGEPSWKPGTPLLVTVAGNFNAGPCAIKVLARP